jgi:coenzyme F420-0:L-glutamate ligase / coenzyme F420-1:gamma-L-glutamate ligase
LSIADLTPPGRDRPERRHVADRGYDPPASALFTESQVALLGAARVARLATCGAEGAPHVVPVCFAFAPESGVFYIALDEKPKRVDPRRLKRVRNILTNPRAALLCDVYQEDWARLAYCLVHADAGLLAPTEPEHGRAARLLREKYPQYRPMALEAQPMIRLQALRVTAWTGGAEEWSGPGVDGRALRGAAPFAALARGRRSVRRYLPDPIPRAVIEQALEAGRWAPSPHGRLPWRFVVLTQDAAKRTLADSMAAEFRRNLEMDGQPEATVGVRLDKSYERILQAPALILICLYEADLDRYPDPARQAAERTMAIQSLGAAAQNILLAAYGLGLDAGWMCAPLFCPAPVQEALGLAPDLTPQALLTLGYAVTAPRRRARPALSELIVAFD